MNTFLIEALQHYGYPAIWLIVFLAAAGAPISGSLLLSAAGAFAAVGDLNIFILFPLAVSAAVLGDNLTYFIGRRVGLPLLAWLERQKRFRWISPQAVERGREYFRQRTAWAIFLTRFLIVVLGGAINLLAGLEEYPYRKFLFWDISGQILGVIISLGIGFLFAVSWEDVAGLFGAFSGLVLAILVAGIITTFLTHRVRQQRRARAARASAEMATTSIVATVSSVVSVEAPEILLPEDTLLPLENNAAPVTSTLPIPE